MEKSALRKYMRAVKRGLSGEHRGKLSAMVMETLEGLPQFKEAKTIVVFFPLADEIDTTILLDKYLGIKRIFLPVVVADDILLKEYSGRENMVEGPFGILEPTTNEVFMDYESIDLVVVPGVAFTPNGARMGRGRGYYDRFLPLLPNAYKVGVCYPFQLVPELPLEPHDIPLNAVIFC